MTGEKIRNSNGDTIKLHPNMLSVCFIELDNDMPVGQKRSWVRLEHQRAIDVCDRQDIANDKL